LDLDRPDETAIGRSFVLRRWWRSLRYPDTALQLRKLRLRKLEAFPLAPLHIAGVQSTLGQISLRCRGNRRIFLGEFESYLSGKMGARSVEDRSAENLLLWDLLGNRV
jgi:hypothetical protein